MSKNVLSEFFERVLLHFCTLHFSFLSHLLKLSRFENKIIYYLNKFVNMAFLFFVSRKMKTHGKQEGTETVTLQPKDISEDEHKDSETIRQVHRLFSNILI